MVNTNIKIKSIKPSTDGVELVGSFVETK